MKEHAKNLLIYIAAALLAVFVYGIFWLQSQSDSTIQELPPVTLDPCITPQLSEKTVILRVDDVQAFSWFETTKKMVEDAEARRILLSLGVIPVGLEYDTTLIDYLKDHECNLEFALHGWDHSAGADGTEFGSLSYDVALARITPGLANLALLTDETIVTWIPPFNVQSSGTVRALTELGFVYLSAEGTDEWDYDATTLKYGDGNTLVPPAQVIADCERAFAVDRTCVVMLHPQDFADGLEHNAEKYQAYYLDLLDEMVARGYAFARFKDMPR